MAPAASGCCLRCGEDGVEGVGLPVDEAEDHGHAEHNEDEHREERADALHLDEPLIILMVLPFVWARPISRLVAEANAILPREARTTPLKARQ